MAINVANLKPASLKAKNVATEEYVDSSVNESFATLAATEEARDGQIAVFYQTEAPTANIQFGDYWLDTNDSVRSVYRYENVNGESSGTLSWRLNTSAIAKSLQYGYKADLAASAAQTTANSKITTFYQPSVPTSLTAGDIWIDTDDGNKMYIANAANVNSIVTSGNGWYNKTLVVPAPDFTSNNDLFAQAQGFANYSDMQNKYSALGSTIINGGYLNTGLIQANSITAELISADAINGKTITGGTITGSKLYGTQIEGAIIKASYLDLSSTATLTNWQQYTPSNYPSAYANNFAHNNDGTLLVDSLGYVRLMGNTKLRSTVLNSNRSKAYGSYSYDSWTMDFYSYNNYKVNSINRPIISSPKISLVGIDTNATTTIIDVIAVTVYNNNISISGNIQIFNYSFDFSANVSVGSSFGTASGTITLNGVSKTVSGYSGASISNTVSAKGMPITVTLSSNGVTANAEFKVTINDNEFTLSNLTDTDYIKINSLYCYSSGVSGGNPSNGEITMNINIPSFEVI